MKGLLIFLLAFQLVALGQEKAAEKEMSPDEVLQAFEKKLNLKAAKTGAIPLSNGATINLPEGYVFYDAQSGSNILQSWGNPPPNTSGPEAFQGLIFSDKFTALGQPGLTISVDSNTLGYISDEEADDYDYDEILEGLQEGAKANNEARVQQGYPTVNIVGWAATPSYDKQSKKLYFAKEIKFGTDKINTLNYDIHVLGRQGYVKLGFIGDITDLEYVEKERSDILAAVNYNDGYKYADFKDGDKVAEQDFGSLLSGGNIVIAGGILALLVRFKKLLIFGALAVFAFIGKLFGKKEEA